MQLPTGVEASLRASDLDPIFVRRAVQRMKQPGARVPQRDPARPGHNAKGLQRRITTLQLALDRARKGSAGRHSVAENSAWNTGSSTPFIHRSEPNTARFFRAGDGRTEAGGATGKALKAESWTLARFAQRIQANGQTDWEKSARCGFIGAILPLSLDHSWRAKAAGGSGALFSQ